MEALRKSVIAGSWYPGKASILRQDIEKYFAAAPDTDLKGEIVGLIVPHAGYVYSGQVAAYAYKLIRGQKYEAVIVVGPSHRVAFHGVSVFGRGGYETPLGVVPIATDLADVIRTFGKTVEEIPAAHLQEHSLEIQLPFLQVALGDFSFVPLVMGDQNAETCYNLAEAIYRAVKGKKVLIVGSSDLSHFHNYNMAMQMDAIVLKHLQDSDTDGLLKSLDSDICEACGGGPMVVTLLAAKLLGARQSQLLNYANSGDVTGDKSSVVGYAAAAYYK
jgi:AmmeMemoRadiSam system protein B